MAGIGQRRVIKKSSLARRANDFGLTRRYNGHRHFFHLDHLRDLAARRRARLVPARARPASADRRREFEASLHMTEQAFILDPEQRRIVEKTIADHCEIRNGCCMP